MGTRAQHTDDGGEERRFVEGELRDLARNLLRAHRRLERTRQVLAHYAAENRQRVAHFSIQSKCTVQ